MEKIPLPGELLLNEIHKLSKEEKKDLDYEGICRVIAEDIAIRAIRNSIDISDLGTED
jgi:hypothetical protein